MPLMEWNSSLVLGVGVFDDHHKKFLGIINELYDAMKAGKSSEVMGNVLRELVAYTKMHFSAEEKTMIEYAYPGIGAQQREHTMFINKVMEFEDKFKKKTAVISTDVLIFLRDWLVNHIQVSDKKYAPYLNSKGVK